MTLNHSINLYLEDTGLAKSITEKLIFSTQQARDRFICHSVINKFRYLSITRESINTKTVKMSWSSDFI